MASQDDLLDRAVKFLAKREGIDKTLKILRYTARFVAAITPKDQELYKRLAAFESSVGTSRKAYRLGKFLQDINNLRKSTVVGNLYIAEVLAYGGEGIYYFIEQIVWLMKAGALTKEHEKKFAKVSAWAELIGYMANIYLSALKFGALHQQEQQLLQLQHKASKEEGGNDDAKYEKELAKVRFNKAMRLAFILQDLADSTLAMNDIRGGQDKLLSHPVTLALAGLLSGSVSFYKNWAL